MLDRIERVAALANVNQDVAARRRPTFHRTVTDAGGLDAVAFRMNFRLQNACLLVENRTRSVTERLTVASVWIVAT